MDSREIIRIHIKTIPIDVFPILLIFKCQRRGNPDILLGTDLHRRGIFCRLDADFGIDQRSIRNTQQEFCPPGFALDLGAEYQFNDKLKFYASVLDLGFIRWGAENYRFTQNATFDWQEGKLLISIQLQSQIPNIHRLAQIRLISPFQKRKQILVCPEKEIILFRHIQRGIPAIYFREIKKSGLVPVIPDCNF